MLFRSVLVGFTDAKSVALYSSKLARYTAKGGRFRFSQAYGSLVMKMWFQNPVVVEVFREFPGCFPRVSGMRIPRRLYRDQLPVPVDVVFRDDVWRECHGASTLISQSGHFVPGERRYLGLPKEERGVDQLRLIRPTE